MPTLPNLIICFVELFSSKEKKPSKYQVIGNKNWCLNSNIDYSKDNNIFHTFAIREEAETIINI